MTESDKEKKKRLKQGRDDRLKVKNDRQGLMSKRITIPKHLSEHYSTMASSDAEEHRKKLKNKSYRQKLGLPDPDKDE